jgi:predicted 3-demethylubiquinone-9 3-methyltransferase (glyoxalase superfamily)
MTKITPFLWFNENAETAAKFYTSIFKNSKIVSLNRYDQAGAKASGRPAGSVMSVEFLLDGQQFNAINGGPVFKFTEAISFVIDCDSQKEVDYYWDKFTEEGTAGQCGWLKDKFGLSWQIVPKALRQMLGDKNPDKSKRVMQAMLKMTKIDINILRQAYIN